MNGNVRERVLSPLESASHDWVWVCFSLFPSSYHTQGDLLTSQSTISLEWVVLLWVGLGGRNNPTYGVSRNWLIWLQDSRLRMNHEAISFSSSPLGQIKKCWPFIVLCKSCKRTGHCNRSAHVKISKNVNQRGSGFHWVSWVLITKLCGAQNE